MGIFKQKGNEPKMEQKGKKAEKSQQPQTVVYWQGVEITPTTQGATPKATTNQTAKQVAPEAKTAPEREESKGIIQAVRNLVQGPKELPKEPPKVQTTTIQTASQAQDIESTVSALEASLKKGMPPSYYSKTLAPYKPIREKKLTILLIENTIQVAAQKQDVEKIVDGLVKDGLVRIIYYGATVEKTGAFKAEDVRYKELLLEEKVGEEACLYDALLVVGSLVNKSYMAIEESVREKIRINSIEILGIGTCKDNGSKCTKSIAAENFSRVAKKFGIITKYFCLTEESLVLAAEMGFRSIGSISKTY